MGKILIIKGADFSAVAIGKVEPIIGKVSITVLASPSGGGTTTGSGSYEEGSQITISAIASEGYRFKQWNDGNTQSSRTIVVGSSAQTYTAIFEESGRLEEIGGWIDLGKMYQGSSSVYTVAIVSIPTGVTRMNVVGANAPGTTQFAFLTASPTIPTIAGENLSLADNSSLPGWDSKHMRVAMASGETKEFTIPSGATHVVFNCKFSAEKNYKPRSLLFV